MQLFIRPAHSLIRRLSWTGIQDAVERLTDDPAAPAAPAAPVRDKKLHNYKMMLNRAKRNPDGSYSIGNQTLRPDTMDKMRKYVEQGDPTWAQQNTGAYDLAPQPANLDDTINQPAMPPPAEQPATPAEQAGPLTQQDLAGAAAETNPPTAQGMITELQKSIQNFNEAFKAQHRLAQPALRQIYQALQAVQQNPSGTISPEAGTALNTLINTLQQSAADENQDTQLLQQIGTQAVAVAVAMGLNSADQKQFDHSRTGQPQQPGIMDRVKNRLGLGASYNQPILTAEMGSAKKLLKVA